MPNGADPGQQWDRRPVPDPTVLTTEALERETKSIEKTIGRELSGLERLLVSQIASLRELVNERYNLNQTKFLEAHERSDTNKKNLTSLMKEKFKGVKEKLDLIERQRVEQKSDTKLAVDAALNAAKEAVKEQTTASDRAISKSESTTSEQLKQLGDNFKNSQSGLDTRINDLKDRLTRIETAKLTNTETQTEHRASTSATTAYIVAIIAGGGFVVAVLSLVTFVLLRGGK